MSAILEKLRQRIACLEEPQNRFLRTIPIADAVDKWLPPGGLPIGCIHEVKGTSLASAIAFASVLSSRLAGDQGHILYIAPDRSLHPLGLLPYQVKLDRFLHVSTKRSQDLAWAVLEALRCPQVSSVIALIGGLSQTDSRRLQLATETSGATGFLLGHEASPPIASASTRWKISPVTCTSGQKFDEPLWELDLLYCRGGHPGKWIVEWNGQKLNSILAQPVQLTARKALAG